MVGVDVSPLLAIVAFGAALAVVFGFLTDRLRLAVDMAEHRPDNAWQLLHVPPALALWPLVLLVVAFAVSGAANLVWLLIVVAAVAFLGALALTVLRRVHAARGDTAIPGSTVATALALLVALTFYWLLVVRLSVVPDPRAPLRAAFEPSAGMAGGFGILLPAAGIAAVLLASARIGRLGQQHSSRPVEEQHSGRDSGLGNGLGRPGGGHSRHGSGQLTRVRYTDDGSSSRDRPFSVRRRYVGSSPNRSGSGASWTPAVV